MRKGHFSYLLNNDPAKVISDRGVKLRRIISPLIRGAMPLKTKTKLKILHRAPLPDEPVIFACTHGFREDVEDSLITAGRHAYILVGSLEQFFNSRVDNLAGWLNGVILVDREDKESRAASKEKMKAALEKGVSVLMYPEGTWNVSPNKLMAGLFPGVYDVAKETGVKVVPIVTHRNDGYVYSLRGRAVDITKYERNDGLRRLRDKMATMKWSLYEHVGMVKRSELPKGKEAERFWAKFIHDLKAEVPHFEHGLEERSVFRHKGEALYEEVFDFMDRIMPHHGTAFLYNKKYIRI